MDSAFSCLMSVPAKIVARVAFWVVFLAVAGITARQIWVKLDPLRNHPVIGPWWWQHNVARLSSTNRATAMAAWSELERCYLTKWAAYDWVVWRVKENIWQKNDPPIHFDLTGDSRYTPRNAPPSGSVRTVNEALMAMLYQDTFWQVPYQGDWRKWWDANWTYYPNRERLALPSGPEDPRAIKRR